LPTTWLGRSLALPLFALQKSHPPVANFQSPLAFTIRHSLLAILCRFDCGWSKPFAIRHSLFANHYSLFAIRYSPLAFHHSPIASRCRSVNYPSIPAVPSFVLAENDHNEVTEMAKLKTKEEKRKVADMTVDELAELVRQVLREELKFLCSVDDEGNLVFWVRGGVCEIC